MMVALVWSLIVFAQPAAPIQVLAPLGQGSENAEQGLPTHLPFHLPDLFPSKDPDATRVQKLQNDRDAAYYSEIWVGGQKIKAIADTGSFELLVFGSNCSVCGDRTYHHKKSKMSKVTGIETSHDFGSGTTISVMTYDNVNVAGMQLHSQQFWQVTDSDMPFLLDGAFQAIFGVGPPASAIKFAEIAKIEAHKELQKLKKHGEVFTSDTEEIVQHYDDMVGIQRNLTGVIQNLHMENMSFCFGHQSGSAGYLYWNDHASRDEPEKFVTMEVVGDLYWSANLSAVRLENATAPANSTRKQANNLEDTLSIGCLTGNCSAIIDSGTSLITAPSETVNAVWALAGEWEKAGGTCEDLSKLPELKFQLNGYDFVLPPESYMGLASGWLNTDLQRLMPYLHKKQNKRRHDLIVRRHTRVKNHTEHDEDAYSYSYYYDMDQSTVCAPLMMNMDADSQFGELWILGMPFFRTYYSSFTFNHNGTGPPEAATMSFSAADNDCKPGMKPGMDKSYQFSAGVGKAVRPGSRRPRQATMHVDATKLRMPDLSKKGLLEAKRKINHERMYRQPQAAAKKKVIGKPVYRI